MKKFPILSFIPATALLLSAGCGSGSSVTLPQQKTATIIFSAATTATLPTAVRIVKVSAKIPAGVTVPLQLNGGRQVDPGALVAFKSGSTIFGSYSAPLLTIGVWSDVSPTSPGLGITNVGDFAGVKVTYDAGLPLTEGSFTGINPTFPDFAAEGSPDVKLTGFLKPAMRVTF